MTDWTRVKRGAICLFLFKRTWEPTALVLFDGISFDDLIVVRTDGDGWRDESRVKKWCVKLNDLVLLEKRKET